jgi:hypothetical protein
MMEPRRQLVKWKQKTVIRIEDIFHTSKFEEMVTQPQKATIRFLESGNEGKTNPRPTPISATRMSGYHLRQFRDLR